MHRVFILSVSYKNIPQQRKPHSFCQVLHALSQTPEHPFFGFLGGCVPLPGAIQGWLGEMVTGRSSERSQVNEQLWRHFAQAGVSGQGDIFFVV